MRTFGSYEAVEELSRTAFGAVYSARPTGSQEQPSRFVKVFAPPAMSGPEERADSQTENFLAAARLQQKAAESSRHWAPVHEIGTAAEGAYYVSSLYPISARRLVMGKVKLTEADLHALLSAIVNGLKDLRASCSQAHGNIKLTTVLLPRGGEAAYGQAVLAEPLLPHKAAAVTEAADLAALAKLVHHLVTHRPFNDAGGWPIPAGAEWLRLGRGGDAWRELCNTLLNPNPDAAVGIDSLSEMLDKLKPRRPLIAGKLRVAAVMLAVLAGIGYGLYVHYAPYFRYSTADWTQLADAYSGWLRALDTYQSYPQLNAAVQRDPELLAIVRELKESGIVFDTKEILGTRNYGYDEVRERFPTTADGRRRTRVAVEFMPIVQERLKQWQALRLAEQVRQRCETIAPAVARELSRLLAEASTDSSAEPSNPDYFANALAELAGLASLLDSIEKDLTGAEDIEKSLLLQRLGNDQPVFAELPKRVAATYRGSVPAASVPAFRARLDEVKGALESINRDWTALAPRLMAIHDPDDAVLALLPDFIDDALYDEPASATSLPLLAGRVQNLSAEFAQAPWSELHARAIDWKAGGIDKAEFRNSEPYTSVAATEDPRELLSTWAIQAGKYLKLPQAEDPRTAVFARVAQLDDALKRLDADYPPPTAAPEENLRLKAEADAWRNTLSDLRTLKWLGGRRDAIDKGSKLAQADLDGLLARIEQARVVRPEVREAFIARVRGRSAQFGHVLLRRQWQTLEAQWLKDQATWRNDERALRPPAFRALQTSVSQAEARLAAIEAALPRGLAVNVGPQRAAWTDPLIAELERLSVGEHDTALAAAILGSDWSNLAADDFPKQWTAPRDKYLSWRAEAGRLVEDLNLIEALLDGGYGLAAPADEAYARAAKSSQWQAAAKLVQPLVDRIGRLGNLPSARADVLSAAKGDDASLAVAAWRRLKAPDWPSDLAELDEELAIQKRLDDRLNAAKSKSPAAEKHLQSFRTALAAERRSRRQAAWRRLAEDVDHGEQARQQLDALMAKMPACDVSFPPDAELPLKPATLFNMALYRLRQDVRGYAPGEQDGQATARLEQFKREIPESLKNQQELLELVSKLEKAAEPVADQQVLIAQDGPPASPVKAMTWTLEDGGGDEDVRTYKWTYRGQSHTLVFRRLKEQPGIGSDPVFLCTTEVSLGLFMQVIEAAAADQKAADRLSFAGLQYDSLRRGPHVWRAAGSGILPTSSWLSFVEVAFENRVYADELVDIDKPLARQGGRVMPMQRISPAAAMHFSHLMGCRLPTSGEFEVARAMQPAAGPSPNLRDPVWKAQHQYISDIVDREGDAVRAQAPWPDMGTFETATTKTQVGANAQAVQGAADDGFLWFRPVQTNETFCNLIGNVAEYVWEDGKLLEGAPQVKPLAVFRDIVARHARGNLYVTGASAISAPELGFGRHEVINSNNGFADVGLRLAFTVPSRTIVDRIRIVTDKQKYMVASSEPVGSSGPR